MNKETQRIILASILITLVAYFYPNFWGVSNADMNNAILDEKIIENPIVNEEATSKSEQHKTNIDNAKTKENNYENKVIKVSNKLYSTTISNQAGGTLLSSTLIEKNNDNYKYPQKNVMSDSSADKVRLGDINPNNPVILGGADCAPCLAYYDNDLKKYQYINHSFDILTPNVQSEYVLEKNDTLILEFEYMWGEMQINKTVQFYGNSYQTMHQYSVKNPINNKLEVVWNGGMGAIDQADFDWVTGSAMIGQSDETETIQITDDKRYIEREEYNGNTDWVSVRTKYFIAALLAENSADYATMTGYVENSEVSPSYTVGLGYYNSDQINTSVYLGPLDIDHIGALNNTLDETINFGFQIVRPIGKFVLWFLKIIHNTLNLNYGICLIIFAAIIQFLTSPLTKKTYESSRKMQDINPLVKKVQEKYKDDPQKMNKEVMKLYTENGVNPLSGCLPLLLQMPLLMAIFSVFKDTIEFRGATFFLWINDLSQPDILFHLPEGWWIPLYGDHVAFLPILMGISIFLTQRLSMATMDPAQKPMMYAMNGFFKLIFNGFPAGLNLYYTVYNLLNYYQQKTIRSQNQ